MFGRGSGATEVTPSLPSCLRFRRLRLLTKSGWRLFKDLDPKIKDKIRLRKEALKEMLDTNTQCLVVCYGKRPKEFATPVGC
jgi:hypothetical protein